MGGAGDDVVDGGDGGDIGLFGGLGLDLVYGGSGADLLVVASQMELTAGEILDGGSAVDTLVLEEGATLPAGVEQTSIEGQIRCGTDATTP